MPFPFRSMLISTLVSLVTLNSDPMRETFAAQDKQIQSSIRAELQSHVMTESIWRYLMRFKKNAQILQFTIYTQGHKIAEYSISMTWMVKNRKKNCSQQISPVKLEASNLLDIKDTGIVYYEKGLHA
jgi:transcriptional regulator NrdR family protein